MDVESLFRKLHAIYGSAWLNQWPNLETTRQAKAEWGEKLEAFSDEAIRRAVDQLAETNPTRPPNLLQFVKLCRQESERQERKDCCKCPRRATGGFMDRWYCNEHNPQLQRSLQDMEAFGRQVEESHQRRRAQERIA